MKRRTFLASVSAATVGLQAGCLATEEEDPDATDSPTGDHQSGPGRPGDETASPTDQTTPSETPSPTDVHTRSTTPQPGEPDVEPVVLDHDVETVETSCMSDGEEEISLTFSEDGVRIDGVAVAPTPCYDATIESAIVSDGELRVRMGFVDTGDVCVECVGKITYEAMVEIEEVGGIDTVTVVHDENGKAFSEKRAGDVQPPSPTDGEKEPPIGESEFDPDIGVSLVSRHDESHDVHVKVRREDGETVYDGTHEVKPGADREIYNLEEASPDGIEAFEITATMEGYSETVRVETNSCYGEVLVTVSDDGDVSMTYAVC